MDDKGDRKIERISPVELVRLLHSFPSSFSAYSAISAESTTKNPSRANREGFRKQQTCVRYYPFTDSPWEKTECHHHQRRF